MAIQKILTRDFIFTFFAQFVCSGVFFILIPTIPIYLSNLGSSEGVIGVLVGALSVASLVTRPFVGRALLKIPEKDFMIAGALLHLFSSVAYLFAQPFWPFLIARILQGIGLALFATASLTLVTRISPEAHRGQSIGYFFLAINVAYALAPSFGMFIINRFNFTVLFLVCTGLSLGSLYVTLQLKKIQGVPLEDSSPQNQPFWSPAALPFSIMAFMGSILWGAITAFFPLYAVKHGVANPGFFFAAMAITLILGRGFGGRILDIRAKDRVIPPCLLAQITAMTMLAFTTTYPMFILAAVILGAGNAFFYPILVTYAIDLAGPSRGPAVGTYMALSDFGAGMGSVIMGVVIQLTDYRTMFLSLGCASLLNLGYFHFFVRKIERRPRGGDRYANL
jgi:predicted MFS family arabinose efflux permease